MFASAIIGGALVSLLSYLLEAVNSVRSRITIAYIVGFLLALGPFDHVIVTAIHVFSGSSSVPVSGTGRWPRRSSSRLQETSLGIGSGHVHPRRRPGAGRAGLERIG